MGYVYRGAAFVDWYRNIVQTPSNKNHKPFSDRVISDYYSSIIEPLDVVSEGAETHTSVVLYLSYATKTTKKQLLILEFHSQVRHDVAMTLRHGATTSRRPVQQYA
jgi:hypothetical protein